VHPLTACSTCVSLRSFVSQQAKKQRQNRPIPQVSPAHKRSHSSSARVADASRCDREGRCSFCASLPILCSLCSGSACARITPSGQHAML
jgi:hypothetical protein